MDSTLALIPWDPDTDKVVAKIEENSRPEGGGWALVLNALRNPSPGRTLDQVYTSLGTVLEKQANRAAHALGMGPHVVTQNIKLYLGTGEERVRQLELLRTSVTPKLKECCIKLVKYTLPCVVAICFVTTYITNHNLHFTALNPPKRSIRPSNTS
jgi:hypothetical protein